MKEEDAKKKMCPKLFAAFIACGRGNNKDRDSMCLCKGSGCVMWEAAQNVEDKNTKEKPDGDGWYKVSSSHYRRYVDSDSGDCGLKTKELYCEGCNQ